MSSRQTYGCLAAVAELFGWILSPVIALAQEFTAGPVNEQPRGDGQQPRAVLCGLPLT